MWASGQRLTRDEQTSLERLARRKDLPPLAEIAAAFPPHAAEAQIAYLASLSLVQTLEAWSGAPSIAALIDRLMAGDPFEAAFERAFGAPLNGVELAWRAELSKRYSLWRDLWHSTTLLSVAAVLAVIAFLRYWFRRKRLLTQMDASEADEGVPNIDA